MGLGHELPCGVDARHVLEHLVGVDDVAARRLSEDRRRPALDDFEAEAAELREVVRSIGAATGFSRDLLAAGSLLARTPGLDALSRYTGTENLLFRIRKNFFATLEFVAVKTAE